MGERIELLARIEAAMRRIAHARRVPCGEVTPIAELYRKFKVTSLRIVAVEYEQVALLFESGRDAEAMALLEAFTPL